MSWINWENLKFRRCIVCGNDLRKLPSYTCKKCGKVCGSYMAPLRGGPEMLRIAPGLFLADSRSTCCGEDVLLNQPAVDRDECLETLFDEISEQLGEFKPTIDLQGHQLKVRTRELIRMVYLETTKLLVTADE